MNRMMWKVIAAGWLVAMAPLAGAPIAQATHTPSPNAQDAQDRPQPQVKPRISLPDEPPKTSDPYTIFFTATAENTLGSGQTTSIEIKVYDADALAAHEANPTVVPKPAPLATGSASATGSPVAGGATVVPPLKPNQKLTVDATARSTGHAPATARADTPRTGP